MTQAARPSRPATIVPIVIVLAAFALGAGQQSRAEDTGWPREIEIDAGRIVLYQPQVDRFEGNTLAARSAVSVHLKQREEPIFGAVWYDARVETDRDERTVTIIDLKVPKVKFPEGTDEHHQLLARIVEAEFPKWEITLSLDRLIASMELAERERLAAAGLKVDPPRIMVVDYPAILVTLDGDPELRPVENTSFMRVVNTPFPIVFDGSRKSYYLNGGETWWSTEEITGDWATLAEPPADVAALFADEPPPPEGEEQDEIEEGPVPAIVVATEPTELIVTEGAATYTPLVGSDLLYVSNSESDILLEVATQQHYVLLSGRWYRSKSLSKGPWSYVAADDLPSSFSAIPADSDQAALRAFVAGTDEAEEAMMDAQVPQTAAVKRGTAELKVEYDGEPQFEPIEGTGMEYAVNTAFSVLRIEGVYYCVEEAVWYQSKQPSGPWEVSTQRPAEVDAIPPSSPVYPVKYVYIYDSTPEVVYVGYTPSYTGCYIYGPTVVYGTGWYYPGWYGPVYYYPRPATWGFHVRYNPWTGWSFGLSYSRGPFRITFGWGGGYHYHGGWWGAGGYRHGYRHGYRAGYAAGQRNSNIYNRPSNQDRVRPQNRPATGGGPDVARDHKNDVFADRNGDVYRRQDDGWQKRDQDGWKKADPATRPSGGDTRPGGASPSTADLSGPRPSSGGLDRDYQARQRGNQRASSYQSSRGSRGGGGRGRR